MKPKVLIVADSPEWQLIAAQLVGKFWDLADYSVVSTKPTAPGSEPLMQIDFSQDDHPEIDEYTLILSLHCQQILPARLVGRVRCINVHPGYLPYGRGYRPAAFALAMGVPAGATIHVMDAGIDSGPVIDRRRVLCTLGMTVDKLYREIHEEEKSLLWEWMPRLITGEYDAKIEEPWPGFPSRGLKTKKDYEVLCDLGRVDRRLADDNALIPLIKRLAGLTYGSQASAFFTTATGDKIRVGIFMEKVEVNGES